VDHLCAGPSLARAAAQAQSLSLRPTYETTSAQQAGAAAAPDSQPIDGAQRMHWIVDGIIGPSAV